MDLFEILSLVGTATFAWSGVLAGYQKNVDLFGAVVLGVVTAIGGGTLRDLFIGNSPVFWVTAPANMIVAVAASIIAFFAAHWRKETEKALKVADALGLALFTVLATRLAIDHQLAFSIVLTVGVITGCFGGIIRDTLTNRIPYVFTRELYATAALAGAALCWLLQDYPPMGMISGAIAVLVLRIGSIHYGWALPTFHEAEKVIEEATSKDEQ